MREKIGVRLKEERERLGFNQADFAAFGGASKRSQIDWEYGKLVPNAEFLAILAMEIGVDVLYVLTGERLSKTLEKDEVELLNGYRSLDLRGKAGVLGMIDVLSGTPAPKNQSIIHGKVGQQIVGDINGPNTINMPGKNSKK